MQKLGSIVKLICSGVHFSWTNIRTVAIAAFLLMALALILGAVPIHAANSVVVESKTVQGGAANVEIGIFLTNDISVRNLVLPLTLRSIETGAFITKLGIKRTSGGRLQNKLTGVSAINGLYRESQSDTACYKVTVDNRHINYSHGFRGLGGVFWSDTLSHVDTTFIDHINMTIVGNDTTYDTVWTYCTVSNPPVAAAYSLGKLFPSEPALDPGADTQHALHLLVDIANTLGRFEIDTTCLGPQSHLIFAQDGTSAPILPSFTKGIMTVVGSAVQYLGGDGIPRDYSLEQNYPNPFNASTVIRFNTRHDGHVRLEVFNILGQKVASLVDEFRHFGPQAADWDGTDGSGHSVSTGLYFYRLSTNDYNEVRKMLLLK